MSAAEGPPSWGEIRDGELRLRVRVQPRAARSRVVGEQGDALKVAVRAAPVDGAANAAVVETVAEWLGVAKSRVEVVRGATSRAKILRLAGEPADRALARVRAALADLR